MRIKQKRFSELSELTPYISSPAINCSLDSMSVFFANYAQALGEIEILQSRQKKRGQTTPYYNLVCPLK